MSDSKGHLQPVPEYVDDVARKEQFLAEHPDAVIEYDQDASPYERWRGRVPGHEEISAGELGQLLGRLEEIIAVEEAEQRWSGWAFTRIGNQWKAQETAGTRVVFGPTLQGAEARVGMEARETGNATG
jgi:hypothetical protein